MIYTLYNNYIALDSVIIIIDSNGACKLFSSVHDNTATTFFPFNRIDNYLLRSEVVVDEDARKKYS